MKFQTINGWTKEKMKAQIRAKNNGKVASNGKLCLYETPDGNHCAVGCFIPEGHQAMNATESVEWLLGYHEDLLKHMPLIKDGMYKLQVEHDKYTSTPTEDVRKVLCKWIDENVIDT